MPEMKFKVMEYKLLSQSMSGSNLGDISIIEIVGEPGVSHQGKRIEYNLRLSAADWLRLPASGSLRTTLTPSRFTFRFTKGVTRGFFNHVYDICSTEKPVFVDVQYGGGDFDENLEREERPVDVVRFRTDAEPVGEAVEDLEEIIAAALN